MFFSVVCDWIELQSKIDRSLNNSHQGSLLFKPSESIQLQVLDDADWEECFTCPICSCVFFECCSVQPCLHNFCTVCWLEWNLQRNTCPICCQLVETYSKNHQLNCLVDLFIRRHPNKARSQDEKRQIADKTLRLTAGSSTTSYGCLTAVSNQHILLGDVSANDHNEIVVPQPSRSSSFSWSCEICRWNGSSVSYQTGVHCPTHLNCTCCCRPIPGHLSNELRCSSCQCIFCRQTGCFRCPGSCLTYLSDSTQLTTIPARMLLDNLAETQILSDYLQVNRISATQFIQTCLTRFHTSLFGGTIENINAPLCRPCNEKCLARLAYEVRSSIPNDSLPNNVTRRPNCYYGSACRSQSTNQSHARAYNHIC